MVTCVGGGGQMRPLDCGQCQHVISAGPLYSLSLPWSYCVFILCCFCPNFRTFSTGRPRRQKIPLFASWGIFLNCLSLCLMSFVFVSAQVEVFQCGLCILKSSFKKRQSYTIFHYLLSHHESAREMGKSRLAPRIDPGPRIIRRGLLPQHDTGTRKLLEESVHLCVFSTLNGRYWIKCFLRSSLHL